MTSDLLKQAIADAKAVRATALANARAALEEAFTPHLQSMLSKKLQQEVEGEEGTENLEGGEFDSVSVSDPAAVEAPAADVGFGGPAPEADVPVADEAPVAPEAELPLDDQGEIEEYGEGNPDPVVQAELTESDSDADYKKKTSGHKTEDPQGAKIVVKKIEGTKGEPHAQGEPSSAKAGHKTPDPQGSSNELSKGPSKSEKNATGKVLENQDADGDDSIDSGTLDEILKELESEVNAVTNDVGSQQELPVAEDCGAETQGATAPAGEDEEINLDELFESDDKDADDEDEKSDEKDEDNKPAFLKENVSLKAELAEYRKAVDFLRARINEVNLLNAKLLYTNRLFKAASLSKEQKIKVIESFDLTKSVREAKLVYATLAESLNFGGAKKVIAVAKKPTVNTKAITEGLASKVVGSTKPTKTPEVLSEGADLQVARFQKLAGIKKK